MDGWMDRLDRGGIGEGGGGREREREAWRIERESQERAGEDGFSWKKRRSFLARAKREANL